MAKKRNSKRNNKMSVGGIIGIALAIVLLIALFAGIIFFVHSGKAGVSESAGVMNSVSTTVGEATTAEEETTIAEEVTDENGNVVSTTDKDTSGKSTTTKKAANDSATTKSSSSSIPFKSSLSAKQFAKYFKTDADATRVAYDGKTVTLSGTLSGKSAKMLYVELNTGNNIPCRIYLNSEEQREQFNKFNNGDSLKVKGEAMVIMPTSTDPGGFQDMANGMVGLNEVTLVK